MLDQTKRTPAIPLTGVREQDGLLSAELYLNIEYSPLPTDEQYIDEGQAAAYYANRQSSGRQTTPQHANGQHANPQPATDNPIAHQTAPTGRMVGQFAGFTEQEQAEMLSLWARQKQPAKSAQVVAGDDWRNGGTSLDGNEMEGGMELEKEHFEPLHFLVDGLLARGQFIMLAGRPKGGKSWLVSQLAECLDLGVPFLGISTKKAKVLYIALEDGRRRLNQRFHIRKYKPTKNLAMMFKLSPIDSVGGKPGPGLDYIAHVAPLFDLIVIDTLISAMSGQADESSNQQMSPILHKLRDIAHDSDTAIVLVHHIRKPSGGAGGAGDDDIFHSIRGAGAIRGAYDVGLVLDRKKSEDEAVLHMESRDMALKPITIRQVANNGGWQHVGDEQAITNIRAGRKVVEALQKEGDGATAQELSEILGVSVSATQKQLNNAERDGLVRKESGKPDGFNHTSNRWHVVAL